MPTIREHNATWFVVNRAKVEGPAFFDDTCLNYFQLRLLNSLKVYHVRLHAYVLLPDEAWLLCSPELPKSLLSMLEYVNGCYSEYFNERFGRSTAVFPSRPHQAIIDSAQLLLDCQRLIESWPLAGAGVSHAGRYPWSSYAFNAFGGKSRFLSRHRFFRDYIATTDQALQRYRESIATPFDPVLRARLEQRLLPPGRKPEATVAGFAPERVPDQRPDQWELTAPGILTSLPESGRRTSR